MKDYKRLTFKRSENASAANYNELLNRLTELEDKIENGTLVEVESPCTKEEFDYVCKYYENGLCHLNEELFGTPPQPCHRINDPENCMGSKPIEENKKESKNMKKCKFYAETARGGWCSNVDCLLEKCYFSDDFNSCELFDPIKCEKELSPLTLNYDKARTTDNTALTIQNCDKIILKPKSLEVEVKIEKDNFDDFDFIIINGHKFKKV